MKRSLLIAALLVVQAAGCAKAPPVPVDKFYRLPEPKALKVEAEASPWGKLVYVSALQATGLHTERAILFSEDAHAVSLSRYHYHHWVDGPPRLVQDYLAASLRRAVPSVLVLTEPDGRPDVTISGKIKRFEHQVPRGKGNGKAVVVLELRVIRSRSGDPLLVKDYRAAVDVSGVGMTSTANAFGAAVANVMTRFIADAGAALAR